MILVWILCISLTEVCPCNSKPLPIFLSLFLSFSLFLSLLISLAGSCNAVQTNQRYNKGSRWLYINFQTLFGIHWLEVSSIIRLVYPSELQHPHLPPLFLLFPPSLPSFTPLSPSHPLTLSLFYLYLSNSNTLAYPHYILSMIHISPCISLIIGSHNSLSRICIR